MTEQQAMTAPEAEMYVNNVGQLYSHVSIFLKLGAEQRQRHTPSQQAVINEVLFRLQQAEQPAPETNYAGTQGPRTTAQAGAPVPTSTTTPTPNVEINADDTTTPDDLRQLLQETQGGPTGRPQYARREYYHPYGQQGHYLRRGRGRYQY